MFENKGEQLVAALQRNERQLADRRINIKVTY